VSAPVLALTYREVLHESFYKSFSIHSAFRCALHAEHSNLLDKGLCDFDACCLFASTPWREYREVFLKQVKSTTCFFGRPGALFAASPARKEQRGSFPLQSLTQFVINKD
jgi:hypothetical protein